MPAKPDDSYRLQTLGVTLNQYVRTFVLANFIHRSRDPPAHKNRVFFKAYSAVSLSVLLL
jgi:hypothetical protein